MASAKVESTIRKKTIPYRKIMIGVILALVGIRLLWSLPITRQAAISLLGSPKEIPLRTLNAPNAIRPETVGNIHLLAHWGNGVFYSMAWSPDGRTFAIGTTLGVNLYEAKTFQLLRAIRLPLRGIEKLVFSPDSNFLAVSSAPGNILILDLADDKIVQQSEFEKPVVVLTYLNDGILVCVLDKQSGRNERTILKLVNGTWRTVKTLNDDFLLDVAFVPEKQAFVVYYEKSVRLIDPLHGSETMLPHTVPYGGDFLLTHDILLTVDRDRNLVFTYHEGKLLKSVELQNSFTRPVASPDGSLLATITPSPDNELGDIVTFWDLPKLKPIRAFSIPDMSPYIPIVGAFSPSGDQFAVLVSNSTVKIFSTTTDQFSVIQDSFASIAGIAVTPEGEIRAVSCSGTIVKILNPPSEYPIAQWDFDELTCGQLLDDAVTVAVPGSYANTRFYRVGEAESSVSVGHGCCRAFSDDGNVGITSGRIASSGEPVTVAIWQKRFGLYHKWKFYDAGTDAFNVAVSPSGQYAAATGPTQTYLWVHGIESGRQYPELRSQMSFSPDEKYLASTSGIINLATGQITLTELEDDLRYYPYFSAPAFSPNGQVLAAGVEGTIRFWQVNNGALITKLDDPDFSTSTIYFSPDGTFLVGLGEGFVNVWGISETVH